MSFRSATRGAARSAICAHRSSPSIPSLILLALLLAPPAGAATISWTNQGGGDWSVASNWSTNTVPGAGDDVVLGLVGASPHITYTVALSGPVTVNSLTVGVPSLTDTASFQTLNVNGQTLTINGASTVEGRGTILLNSGTLAGAGALGVDGTITWGGGTINRAGLITINAPGDLNIDGPSYPTLISGTIVNNGTITLALALSYFSMQSGAVIDNNNAFTMTTDAAINTSGGGTINNAGTFTKTTAAGLTDIAATFNNSGTVNVNSGTLELSVNGAHTGAWSIGSGATLRLAGGTQTFGSGSTIAGAGTLHLISGTMDVLTNLSIDAALVNLAGATLTGTGNRTITNQLTFDYGYLSGTGTTTIAASTGSLIVPNTPNYPYINGHTVLNLGVISYLKTGGYLTIQNGATLNNASAFTIDGSAMIYASGTGPNRIVNSGSMTKSGTAAETVIYPAIENSGTLAIQAGTLTANGGGTYSGPVTVATALKFNGGTHTFLTGGSISGAGSVDLSNGTLNADNPLTIGVGLLNLNGGTLGGAANRTITGPVQWSSGIITGGAGTTTQITAAGSLVIPSGTGGGFGYPQLSAHILALDGPTTYSSSYYLQVANGAQISNSSTFTMTGDARIAASGTASLFANSGTIVKTGGADVATIEIPVNNDGTVTASSGTLALGGGGTSNGSFSAGAGAALRFSAGSHFLGGSSSVSGAGVLEFTGGGIVLNGTYAVTGLTRVAGATATFDAPASTVGLSVEGGIMQGSAAFTVSGAFTFAGGTLRGTGTTTVQASGSASIPATSGYATLDGRTLILQANATYGTGGYYFSIYNGGVLSNTATFDILGDAQIYTNNVGSPRIDNSGTFRKTGGIGETIVWTALDNSGTVGVSSGTLSLNGGGTSSGNFGATAPGILYFNGGTHSLSAASSVSGTGTIRFGNGAVTIAGAYALSPGGTTLVAAGTHSFDGPGPSSPNLTLTGGTMQGSSAFTVSDAFAFNGGVLKGSATTTILASVTSSSIAVSTSYSYLDGRTLVLNANTTYGGGGYYLSLYNGGVLQNNATFTLTGDQVFYSNNVASPAIENAGTFVKNGGTGETTIHPLFNNSGTASVLTGTLSLNGGGTSTGSFSATTPGTLRFLSGAHTLGAASSISGTGTIRFGNATTSLSGTYSLTGNGLTVVEGGTHTFNTPVSTPGLTVSNGTMQGPGAVVVSSAFTFSGGSLTGPGTTTIQAGATSSIPSTTSYAYLDGRTLALNADTTLGGGGYYLSIYNGAVLQNLATLTAVDDKIVYSNNVASPRIENSGTFVKNGGTGEAFIYPAFNNTGLVSVQTGTLTLGGGGTSTGGTFTVASPAALRFNGGTCTLDPASSIGGNGTVRFSNATTAIDGTYALAAGGVTLVDAGTHTFTSGGSSPTLTISNGTMQGTGAFTVSDAFTFSGGSLKGPGTTTVLAGATSSISNSTSYTYLDGRTLVLNASTTYGGGGYYFSIYNGGVLQNAATFTLINDATIYWNGVGSPRIENASGATFQKTGGTGTSAIYPPIQNAGTVSVSSGRLQLTSGATGAGAFNADAPGTLHFSGGSHALTGAVTSTGTVDVTNATVTLSGSFTNSGLTSIGSGGTLALTMATAPLANLDIAGGTLGGSATVTIGNAMNWTSGTVGGTAIVEIAPPPAAANITGAGTKYLYGGTLRNAGAATWSGNGWIYGNQGGKIQNLPGGYLTASGNHAFAYACCTGAAPLLENQAGATFERNGNAAELTRIQSGTFTNAGTVLVTAGTLELNTTPFTQTAGTFQIASGATVWSNGSVDFQGGALMGGGTFQGNILNSGGSLKAGTSPGILTITGSYTQGAGGSLDAELGGLTAGTQFDQLNVAGTASLGGTLNVLLIAPYMPSDGNAYRILTFGSLAPPPNNAFATVNGTSLGGGNNLQVSTGATYIDLVTNGNYAPTAVADSATTPEDAPVGINVLANDSDTDGDPLTISGATPASNGVAGCGASTCTYTPNPNFFGSDSFTYTVSDGFTSSTAAVTITITAVNDPPVAANDSATTPEGQAVTINVVANDSDVDLDALSATLATPPSNGTASCSGANCVYTPSAEFNGTDTFAYTVSDGNGGTATAAVSVTVAPLSDAPVAGPDNYATSEDAPLTVAAPGVLSNDTDADGDPLTAAIQTLPASGTVTLASNGSFTYTPSPNFNGTDSFTYTASDPGAMTSTATVTIAVTAVADAPVANADAASTAEDTPVTFNVIANDSDADGDPLSLTANTTPANGSVVCAASGACTYTPSAGYNGTDTFSYTLSDGNATATGTVTITVTASNDVPVANADAATTNEDAPVTVNVLANDTDADGQTLTVSANTQGANGTVSCAPGGACTYTPNPNFNGTDSFTYSATDGTATATATVSITISPVNDAPVANPDSAATSDGTPVTVNVLANDVDIDGNALSITGSTNGANGAVACSASACTYTPASGFSGTDTFTYTIGDGSGGTATGTVTVAVSTLQADLSIQKSSPVEATRSQSFSYILEVHNAGPATATGVVLTDTLPSGVSFVGASGAGWSCSAAGAAVTCSTASLGSGVSSLVALQVRAPDTTGSIVNTASVSSSVADPLPGNNTDSATTKIVAACVTAGPTLLAPKNNVETTSPVGFAWGSVAGAVRYRLTIVAASGTQEKVLTATSASVTLDPGAVNWSVAAEFENGCPAVTSSGSFTVKSACPAAGAQPTGPSGSVATSSARLTWTRVPEAVRYDVFVSFNGGASSKAGSIDGAAASPSLEISLLAGAAVSWYVETIFAEGCPILRSQTATFNASCFPPELSLQGEVTSGKPYEVRASIVSVGGSYLFEESSTPGFETVTASKRGTVDPTGRFVAAVFEHTVAAATPFFYRVRVDQTGCQFSSSGRIVVIPLPPPTSVNTQTVVQFGREEEIRQDLFVASPTPNDDRGYTFVATTDRDWMRVEPAAGTIGRAGITLSVVTNPVGLPVGTNTGTVTLTFTEIESAGKGALQTAPVTGSTPVSVTLVTPVTNKGKDAPSAESLIIPAVAHATGVNSEWQSDIRVLNLGTETQKYKLLWTNTATDATLSGKASELELAPGQNAALDDIVKQWYGLGSMPGEGATGVLEIRPVKDGAGKGAAATPVTRNLVTLASSRTYNRTPQGTLGEYIPAVPFASFVGGATPPGGEKSVLSLQQLAQSSAYRTNIGVTEASGNPVSVEMRFFDGDGSKILTVPLELRSGEHRQLNQILAENGLTNVPTARAEVEVVKGDGKITAYASVVDNITGDPLQVHAVDLAKIGSTKYVLPGIAHFNTGQARWRTDVQMFNAGAASVSATVAFFPVGATTPSKTATVQIDPGKIRTLGDIVPTLFGESNTGGAIQISTATNSELVVTGRTYDQRDAGSYGQFMAAVTEDEAIGLGDRAMQVLQMEQSSDIRSNLGLVEVTGKEVRVELSAFPAESRVAPRVELTLKPNEFRQINQVLKALNTGTTYNARIALRVIGGNGKVIAYGSAVDNLTQDPTFIPGQ